MFKIFIQRPVLATVISVLLVILGVLGLNKLPLQQFPDIAPPSVLVTAVYPGANAETVFQLEKKLAEAQMARVEMRDPYKTYNKFAFADFNQKTPAFNWALTFQDFGTSAPDSILVGAPKFFEAANKLLNILAMEATSFWVVKIYSKTWLI